jgi:hypothetical protein
MRLASTPGRLGRFVERILVYEEVGPKAPKVQDHRSLLPAARLPTVGP